MTILAIINQIDASLSRLRLARDILAKSPTDPPAKRSKKKPPSKKKAGVAPPKPQHLTSAAAKTRRRTRTDTSNDVARVAHIPSSSIAPADDVALLSGLASITVPPDAALAEADASRLPSPPDIAVRRLPYKGPRQSLRLSHTRSLEISEPAHSRGALVASVNSKIVVVSPAQARKERERTTQPEIQPRSLFKSGLTGRLAFDSLFKDTSSRSN